MFLFKKRYFFSVIFLMPFYLSADTYSVNDKLYFGIGGGIISPNDVEIKTTTALTANNVAFSANIDGEFEFDNGYQITGLLVIDYLIHYPLNQKLDIQCLTMINSI